jgi:addiction module HigA family antidote
MPEYRARRDQKRSPIHPGELLREIIPATGKSKVEIAALLGISRQHLYDLLEERKPVSPAVAARLGKLFGDGAGVWGCMQSTYMILGMPNGSSRSRFAKFGRRAPLRRADK